MCDFTGNNVSQVLRRVEAGERLRVTVSGRPVAALVPLSDRPQEMPWQQFLRSVDAARADAALTDELRELLPGRTAGVPVVTQDSDYDDVPGLELIRV